MNRLHGGLADHLKYVFFYFIILFYCLFVPEKNQRFVPILNPKWSQEFCGNNGWCSHGETFPSLSLT